jgi:hypothetical protein
LSAFPLCRTGPPERAGGCAFWGRDRASGTRRGTKPGPPLLEGCRPEVSAAPFDQRVIVTGEVTLPPALEVMVVSGGEGTLVKVIVNTPVANGITGPISPV